MNRSLINLLFLVLTSSLQAQVSPAVKITAANRPLEGYFGNSVAIDGNVALVGKANHISDNDAGSASVFQRDAGGNWNEIQVLTPSDIQPGDHFGAHVSISGDYMAITSWNADLVGTDSTLTNAGAVYIFEKGPGNVWQEAVKITAPDARSNDYFGRVALSGRFLVVGSYTNLDEQGANFVQKAGGAYVFERTDGGEWLPVQKLTASDRLFPDTFFSTVAIDGNTIAVGAIGVGTDATGGNMISYAGAVYVFNRAPSGIWSEVQKITPSIRAYAAKFGNSLDVSGNTLLVGAYSDNTDENGTMYVNGAGSAYLFENNGAGVWSQVKKLIAHDRHDNDRYGFSVSISGHYALVSAHEGNTDENGANFLIAPGSAYLYEKAGSVWSLKKKLVAPDRSSDDEFGKSVWISGTQIIIGAPREDDTPDDWMTGSQGAAYIFTIENPLELDEEKLLSIQAYPNPTDGTLTITGCEFVMDLTITLRDVSGKLLNQTTASQPGTMTYHLNQPEGLYFLVLSSGNTSVVKKILVN